MSVPVERPGKCFIKKIESVIVNFMKRGKNLTLTSQVVAPVCY